MTPPEPLRRAPRGIDAEVLRELVPDARWGVRVADAELGWPSAALPSNCFHDRRSLGRWDLGHATHGHATLAVVGACDTGAGCGVLPGVEAGVFPVLRRVRGAWTDRVAEAVDRASAWLARGDVLVLPVQTTVRLPDGRTLRGLPCEVHPAVFDAIRRAVRAGRVVVEAAGDADDARDRSEANDLDALALPRPLVVPARSPRRDSGAILVGAGVRVFDAALGGGAWRWHLGWRGARVDCFAHGAGVAVGVPGRPIYGATSCASAVVAAAAAGAQAMWRRRHRVALAPRRLRALLAGHATPALDGESIGRMPDLRAVGAALGLATWVYLRRFEGDDGDPREVPRGRSPDVEATRDGDAWRVRVVARNRGVDAGAATARVYAHPRAAITVPFARWELVGEARVAAVPGGAATAFPAVRWRAARGAWRVVAVVRVGGGEGEVDAADLVDPLVAGREVDVD